MPAHKTSAKTLAKTSVRPLLALALPVLSALFPLAGCGRADSSDGEVAADSTDTADLTAALTSTTTDGIDPAATTSAAAATTAEAKAKTFFQPSGCLTTQVTGPQVAYTFNGCTGPYGLVNLKGSITGTYAIAGGQTTIALKGQGLTANNTPLNLDAAVVLTGAAGSRTAAVTSKTSATTPRGRTVEHSGSYVTTWDSQCLTLSGTFSTRVGLVSWMTAIASYKRCQNACPQSGSVVITAGTSAVTVTFGGGATAQVVTAKGDTATVPLFCGK